MNILAYPLLTISALIALKLVNNWRKLQRAPGPLLAGITDFWRAWQQYNGKLRSRLVELHEEHGPVVRYGVRSISLSDPSAIDIIYGSRQGFTTAESYKVLIGISNGKEVPSLVSTSDEARHGALRRAVASAFSPNGVLEYEPFVDETISELLDVLQAKKGAFDLAATILYYTMDAAGWFSFGEPLGCLQADCDVGGSIQMIRNRFNHWGWWSSLPWLERLIYRNPVAMRQKRAPSSMAAAAMGKLRTRMGGTEEKEAGRPADLLSRFIEASRAHPDVLDTAGIVGMLMSTISGAGDTTASSVIAVLYYLMKDPPVLAKLREELATAALSKPVPKFSQVSKLPYLHAVIREAARLAPTSTWPIERRVPAGGITIAGVCIPEGTSVGTLAMATHLDRTVFGGDVHTFRPDRWLTTKAEELRRMEGAFMGFSRGRRVCLGQHIAVLQMKKVLSVLVTNFDMCPVNTEEELDFDMSPAVVAVKPFLVTIQRRK
ncbi:hypothetical protein N0V93_001137 [Gnomoniopsis smithogilvyi]|uniref:Pisatin demethylase n=1 Tax=Gnomoniopsis smithogilvyi TaxID=1191159 RepID=A0A9W8Z360_9PEZI|nr:hypothetical protein N0V93_001137 [Gnomoniopsis smithogilvyi]